MRYLRTNTATIVTVGPFFDKTDGVTIETGLTITNERITFVVDLNDGSAPTLVLDNVTGAASGTSNDLNYITNCDAGLMQLELAAANVNYVGRAFLTVTDAANHCPVFHEFTILPAQVYDSLVLGTDLIDASMAQVAGTTCTARDLGASVLLSSGTGTGQVSLSSGAVLLQATQTGVTIPTVTTLTNLPAITTNWLTATGINAGAITNAKFAAGAIDAAAIANGAIDNATFAADVGSTAYATNVIALAADKAIANAALATAANLATLAGYVDTEVAAILADTNELQTDWANGGRLDLILDAASEPTAAAVADAVWDEALAGHAGAGSAGEALSAAGTAGDPWTTALPGAYGAGTAGKIIGDNINAPVGTVDTVVDGLATELAKVPKSDGSTTFNVTCVGDIKSGLSTQAELNKVPKSDGSSSWNATALAAINGECDTAITDAALATAASLATVAGYLDTEIASILEDTGTTLPTAIAAIPTAPMLATEDGSSFTALPAVTLANGAHGGAAATLALKSATVTNSDGGGTAVGIVANAAGGKGLVVSGVAADIEADITGTVSGTVAGVTPAAAADVLAQVQAAINEAFTDATALTANGLKERIRRALWILQNRIEITDADGTTVIRKDDNTTQALAGGISDNSTTTVRTRMA